MIHTDTNQSTALTEENKDRQAYYVYVVFHLPPTYSDESLSGGYDFLLECLEAVQEENDMRISDHTINSQEYFTSLNHAERYRLPKTIKRLNVDGSDLFYGVLAFEAFRHESVKNKAYNQRITSINPDILVFDRMRTLFIPTSYPHDLSKLGQLVNHEAQGFIQIHLLAHHTNST